MTGWVRPKSNRFVLVGWDAIGEYLGVSGRQAMRYHERKGLPIFQLGKYIKSHKDTLQLWMMRQEKN